MLPTYENDLSYLLNAGTIAEPITRPYFGLSSIGSECWRKIQYEIYFASVKAFPVRVKRIFDLGHLIEIEVVKALRAQGVIVENDQKEVVGFGGHWKGHIDGEASNVPSAAITKHLLEIKSMADLYFKKVVKNGLKISNPEYYDQMQSYMDYGKYERGLFVVYNKNTSEMHSERIRTDHERQRELRKKESEICISEKLFSRIGNDDPNFFKCKMCNHRGVCYSHVQVEKSCRSCKHSDMINDGKWQCEKYKVELSFEEQKRGCESYKKSEMFITVKDITNGDY